MDECDELHGSGVLAYECCHPHEATSLRDPDADEGWAVACDAALGVMAR
jgi:hypothetical protein